MQLNVFSYPKEMAALQQKVVFAFGVFEGLHLGHQEIVKQLKKLAKQEDAIPVVVFFDPSPKTVFFPENPLKMIYPIEKKMQLFQEYGINHLVRFPFTKELAKLQPEEFLQEYFFSAPISVAGFCVGEDWRFGNRNSGNAETLRQLAAEQNVPVNIVSAIMRDEMAISSTRIRAAICDGKFGEASQMLGRSYAICGKVQKGLGIAGTDLECPTANVFEEDLLLPPWGIYAAKATVEGDNKELKGIIYIGDAPSVRNDNKAIIELHLFEFSEKIYGKKIQIFPVKFLRKSEKFESLCKLKEQIDIDLKNAREVLGLENRD